MRERLSNVVVWLDWHLNHRPGRRSRAWPAGMAPISERLCGWSTEFCAWVFPWPEDGDEGGEQASAAS